MFQVPVQVHKVPEARVQDSVAEPVQWTRTREEEKAGGSRSRQEEKSGWSRRRGQEEKIGEQKSALVSLGI